MLLTLAAIALLWALAALAVARIASAVLRRLGLDLMTVLLWFGLAEWPVEGPARRERRVRLAVEASSAP